MENLIPPDYDIFGNEIQYEDQIETSLEQVIETIVQHVNDSIENQPSICYCCAKEVKNNNIIFNIIKDGTIFCSEECYKKYYELCFQSFLGKFANLYSDYPYEAIEQLVYLKQNNFDIDEVYNLAEIFINKIKILPIIALSLTISFSYCWAREGLNCWDAIQKKQYENIDIYGEKIENYFQKAYEIRFS